VKSTPLLIVFALTAIATAVAQRLPNTGELRALALLLDVVPFGAVVAATVIAGMRFWRVSPPRSRFGVAAYSYFAGAIVGALGLAHLVSVVMTAMDRSRQNQFVYDFRFYSLVLLGVLLVAAGFLAAIAAAGLARGDRAAWRASLAVWSAILVINVPLIPIQGFAVLFSALAALELVLLAGLRARWT
jgi:hypothetical protein